MLAELSSRTFWNFVREFSSFQAALGGYGRAALRSGHGSVGSTQVTKRVLVPGIPLRTHAPAGFRSSAVRDHAAALMDGHLPHAADRLASMRARRAAAASAVRSAGTASPPPK